MSPNAAKIAEYQAAVRACALARALLEPHDLPAMLAAIAHSHAVAPILDPTLYRDRAPAMEQDRALLEAALPLARLAVPAGALERLARATAAATPTPPPDLPRPPSSSEWDDALNVLTLAVRQENQAAMADARLRLEFVRDRFLAAIPEPAATPAPCHD